MDLPAVDSWGPMEVYPHEAAMEAILEAMGALPASPEKTKEYFDAVIKLSR